MKNEPRARRETNGTELLAPHTLIHEFKLSERYVKTVNMDVISLGFPEMNVPKWLNVYVCEYVQERLVRCRMRKKFDDVELHNWEEVVNVNVGDRFTSHTAEIKKLTYLLCYAVVSLMML